MTWRSFPASRVVAGGAPPGSPPSAPSNLTSVTADASATVSFLPPTNIGSSAVTSYTVTPYAAGVPQSPVTVAAGSAGSITGSNGSTYVQIPVTGLTNSTAYTFTAHASNSAGAGAESVQSGENTPLAGLVFGDDFNGAAGGAIDPEWWVYTRCGYLAQSEVQYYLPSQVALNGSGSVALTAQHTSHTGPSYPSAGGGTVTQPWISGACQSNAKTWAPAAGNTMTFEVRQQPCADEGSGFWPGLFWLEGQAFLDAWKTDPDQTGWNDTTMAEIDVAEWPASTPNTAYSANVFTSVSSPHSVNPAAGNLTSAMHVYQARWKPGVKVEFWFDGSLKLTVSSGAPASGARFFLLLYLQMVAGGPTTTESCLIDYVRVYDQNLG